jgi:hypothetical protein
MLNLIRKRNLRLFRPRQITTALAATLLALPLSGCYSTGSYRGNGTIVKTRVGSWLLHCNYYKVSLGSIDLTKHGTRSLSMQGLPHEEMCLGFKIPPSEPLGIPEENRSDAVLNLLLVDDHGRTVIHQGGRLNSWVWSSDGFVYHRGTDPDNNQKPLDDAHGTYFKPRTRAKYKLTIEILEPDSKLRYDRVEVQVHSLCF